MKLLSSPVFLNIITIISKLRKYINKEPDIGLFIFIIALVSFLLPALNWNRMKKKVIE